MVNEGMRKYVALNLAFCFYIVYHLQRLTFQLKLLLKLTGTDWFGFFVLR